MEAEEHIGCDDPPRTAEQRDIPGQPVNEHPAKVKATENSLRNTFGWARIDVLVMMIGGIFLFSLCFSLLVEALQTLVHIDHNDAMHYPVMVFIVGGVGLLLNGLCYLLIGGYTFHQGSYFHVTSSGDVVLDRSVTVDSLRQGQRRLSSQTKKPSAGESVPTVPQPCQRQGLREMTRDVISCVFVILCSAFVFMAEYYSYNKYTRLIDPVISIFSVVTLLILSYPYLKEAGFILLQTIPNDINIDMLRKELLAEFPDIVNVHDLHVWQFTSDKVFATSHLVFLNQQAYLKVSKSLPEFFSCKGITQATTQAEFLSPGMTSCPPQQPCLTACLTQDCRLRNCCVDEEVLLHEVQVDDKPVTLVHRKNGEVREVV